MLGRDIFLGDLGGEELELYDGLPYILLDDELAPGVVERVRLVLIRRRQCGSMLFVDHTGAILVSVVYHMADSGMVICSILNYKFGSWNQLRLLGDDICADRDGLDLVVKLGHLSLGHGELLQHRRNHLLSLPLLGLQMCQELHMLLPLLNLHLFQIRQQSRIVVWKHIF